MPLSPPPKLAVPRREDEPLVASPAARLWQGIAAVPLVDVVTGAPPRQATELRAAATESELRLLFRVHDNDVWATLTQRDAPLYTEEVVEVFLDPAGDLQAYFEIELNPLGTVLDLLVRRNRRGLLKDFRWQCEGLRTQVDRQADGWFAEFGIPWAGLSTPVPVAGTRWRANFTRIDRPQQQRRELSAWSPTGEELFHVPRRFGHLEFTGV